MPMMNEKVEVVNLNSKKLKMSDDGIDFSIFDNCEKHFKGQNGISTVAMQCILCTQGCPRYVPGSNSSLLRCKIYIWKP